MDQPRKHELTHAPSIPLCPSCGRTMRLVTVSPDTHFTNLNIHDYNCDCGKDTSFLIASED